MMVEISISSTKPHFSQCHQIFGLTYIIEFEWIENEGYFVMHLYNALEEAIALGLKVQTSWPIFIHREHNTCFFLVAKNSNTNPCLKTLATDFTLIAYELI